MSQSPQVSVTMITYEHEAFIARALDSVLMQETDFDFEVLVGDDGSKDQTGEIVRAYAARYPDRVRATGTEDNVGSKRNFLRNLDAARGKYIAWLDGDDFWSSPHKLQRQVDQLNRHPESVMCFHSVTTISDDRPDEKRILQPPGRREVYTLADFARTNLAYTSSVMFRNGLLGTLPECFWHVRFGDWLLYSLLLRFGNARYIDEPMSTYRVHSGGDLYELARDVPELCKAAIRQRQDIADALGPDTGRPFVDAAYLGYYWLAHACIDTGDSHSARQYIAKCLDERGYDKAVSAAEPFKSWLHLYAPKLYRSARKLGAALRRKRREIR